jgi:hypothetical protein
MRLPVRSSAFALLLAAAVPAFGQEYKNAEKQVRKVTAMATDKTGRRLVSMSVADTLKTPRFELVAERRDSGMDYGSLFVAHRLASGGSSFNDIIAEWKGGASIWQIGDERHANWKQIASAAHKLNTKIEDYVYRHFLNKRNTDADDERDIADQYDPLRDGVKADFEVTIEEIVEAQTRYVFWRTRAGEVQGKNVGLSLADEKAVSTEPSHRTGSGGSIVMQAPSAGGVAP